MEQQVATVLGAVIVAGILWLAKSASETREALVQLKTILTGATGDNGLVSEVKGVRSRQHTLGETLHAHAGQIALLQHDVEELKEARP